MVGLMRAVALDHAGDGITCNAVAPGWIATGSQTTHEASQAHTTPVARAGTPDEVATAITTLCLPGAAYTTGQLLVVDGGNSIAEERARRSPAQSQPRSERMRSPGAAVRAAEPGRVPTFERLESSSSLQ